MLHRLSFLLLFIASLAFGTEGLSQRHQGPPHYMTEEEKEQLPLNLSSGSGREISTPPDFPVRTMGEWEEVQALVITWTQFPTILTEIVRHARKEAEVLIICSDSNSVKSDLSGASVPTSNVDFLEEPYNSVWIRDYGPTSMYRNDVDTLKLMDWIYNRPRPDDDILPEAIADHYGVDLYGTTTAPYEITNPGGNFIPDGMGTAFASELILEENGPGNSYGVDPKSEEEIDSIMEAFMGIDRYVKLPELPYDVIHHIDMHMKLLDEETLLVGEYPTGVADGPQIEANLQYVLDSVPSAFGDPYDVVRIQMPPDFNDDYPDQNGDYRTYTNSVFVNNTLIVPTYEEQYDTSNLAILREELPGYNVVGIECNSIIQYLGAIHCITKLIGVEAPLRIVHQPLDDTYDTLNGYEVNAKIQHRSDIATATLHYTTDTASGYQTTSMSLTDPNNDTWTGSIPAQNSGEEVFYYVEATANSGKNRNRPMPAPDGYWKFKVLEGTSFEEYNEEVGLRIYPNPANAITCVHLENPTPVQGKVSLYSMDGRLLKLLHKGRVPRGEPKYFIDAGKYEAGAYLLVMESEMGRKVKKLLIE